MKAVSVVHIQKVAGIAGSENHLLNLLPRLREHGYEPTMLVLADGEDRPETFVSRMREAGVETDVLPMRGDVDWAVASRLARLLRARRCDIVHTHLLHADLYGALAARWAGVRTIISTRHNPDPFRHKLPIRLLTWGASRAWDHVICISDSVRQFCEAVEGVPGHKLSTIRYGFAPRTIEHGRA